MIHQESLICFDGDVESNNQYVKKTIELFKKLDVRMSDDNLASCVAKLTFKKDRSPWLMFDKGMEVLWISGERQCQRNPYRLFDIYEDRDENPNLKLLTEEDKGVIDKMNIVFLDYFDSETIRKVVAENSSYADREDLHLLPEPPNKIEIIEEFAKRLRDNLEIANNYSDTIFALNNYKSLDKTLSKICKELNLPLEVNESYDQHLKVSTNYFLNSVYFANYHDTPYLDNKGSWYMQLGSQKLRQLARAINNYELLEYKEML